MLWLHILRSRKLLQFWLDGRKIGSFGPTMECICGKLIGLLLITIPMFLKLRLRLMGWILAQMPENSDIAVGSVE
jgi:hypothetical protein